MKLQRWFWPLSKSDKLMLEERQHSIEPDDISLMVAGLYESICPAKY